MVRYSVKVFHPSRADVDNFTTISKKRAAISRFLRRVTVVPRFYVRESRDRTHAPVASYSRLRALTHDRLDLYDNDDEDRQLSDTTLAFTAQRPRAVRNGLFLPSSRM